MISIKTVFLALITVNITAILLLSFNSYHGGSLRVALQEMTDSKASYSFDNPFMAYYILERLDVHEIVPFKDVPGANFTSTASAIKPNFEYCNEHRAYFVNHPESIFKEYKFVSNYWKDHKIRAQVLPVMGKDLHPEVVPSTYLKVDLKVDVGIFFMRTLYYLYRQVGRQFSCLTQASNHIPGHDTMYKKEKVGQSLVEYAKKYESRPQCFNYNKYFPKTWVLKHKDQCQDFFKEFNSPRYQTLKKERNVVYFRKIGADVHQGAGVFPVNDQEEAYIRKLYKNGTLCGSATIKENNLIQYNVWNSLLVEKRKPGFRVFLLVASTNPVIAYYHDGYVRLSLNEYDPQAQDKGTFVTNIHVNIHEAHDGTNPFQGMTEEQINEHTCWFYDRFHKYLMEQGIVTDPNWIENYLRAEFKKVMIHFIRMSQSGFVKKSSVYELFGLDFVMDDKLGVWFIEANAMPLISGFTKDSTILMNKMLTDTFEIIYGLLRSRAKRIISYINALTPKVSFDGWPLPDIEKRREEFRLLTTNRFEPEFMPSPDNTFHRIIDENYEGTERYSNMLEKKCL